MRPLHYLLTALLITTATTPTPAVEDESSPRTVERVTTAVPFPRGLALVDGRLHVLARGRVRSSGGVSAEVNDRAGTLFAIDHRVSEVFAPGADVGEAVRTNGTVVAEPTAPPFRLWDRTANPPESDRETDRPYCVLRFHEPSRNLFICAFSGVDKPGRRSGGRSFSKNLSDGILRYDLRTGTWHEVERHDIEAGGIYPHHDTTTSLPPHGWLNGPNNLLPIGNWLYAVGKDNTTLARYDLRSIITNPAAPPPPSELLMKEGLLYPFAPLGEEFAGLSGASALAHREGWLYVGFRTSGHVLRFGVDDAGEIDFERPVQLIARFDAYDPATQSTADITDISFDESGRLYVLNAQPSRVFRFVPDPGRVFDARNNARKPWTDFAAETGNPRMKSENILALDGYLYITSGDGYSYQAGSDGTVYRVAYR